MRTQIIGCGNRQRMDDGAGALVAERLRKAGIAAEVQSGGAFELVASWNQQEWLILIDAVVTGAPCGTVHVWEGHPPQLPYTRQFSSHGFGLAEAFRLGQILDCLPERITVYGIEGDQFGMGERVSPEVLAAVDMVVGQVTEAVAVEQATVEDAAESPVTM